MKARGYHEVMRASKKQMFFHGHPFRGPIMLTAIVAPILIDTALNIEPSWSWIAWLYVNHRFFMSKLARSVWFNPEKDMYLIHMPFGPFWSGVVFKAGNVVEINGFFANLRTRSGIKAYCPKDLFSSEEDYERMFKRERAVVKDEKLSPKKRPWCNYDKMNARTMNFPCFFHFLFANLVSLFLFAKSCLLLSHDLQGAYLQVELRQIKTN